jgi:hypothetical protein
VTVSFAVFPLMIVCDVGCVVMAGEHEIVASEEFTAPTLLLTRTQYVVVSVSAELVKFGELFPTGVDVSPAGP